MTTNSPIDSATTRDQSCREKKSHNGLPAWTVARWTAITPTPISRIREAYATDEATYMVDSTWHWARILNGFSGGEPSGFMARMRILNALPDPAAVSLMREMGIDVIAVHGATAHAGNPLWDFFSRQDWSRVVALSTGEFVVMVKR